MEELKFKMAQGITAHETPANDNTNNLGTHVTGNVAFSHSRPSSRSPDARKNTPHKVNSKVSEENLQHFNCGESAHNTLSRPIDRLENILSGENTTKYHHSGQNDAGALGGDGQHEHHNSRETVTFWATEASSIANR